MKTLLRAVFFLGGAVVFFFLTLCTMVNHHQTTIWKNIFLLFRSILSKSKFWFDFFLGV